MSERESVVILVPGFYVGGEGLQEGSYDLLYPQNSKYSIDVSIEKCDGMCVNICLSKDKPCVHIDLQRGMSFTISDMVKIERNNETIVVAE